MAAISEGGAAFFELARALLFRGGITGMERDERSVRTDEDVAQETANLAPEKTSKNLHKLTRN